MKAASSTLAGLRDLPPNIQYCFEGIACGYGDVGLSGKLPLPFGVRRRRCEQMRFGTPVGRAMLVEEVRRSRINGSELTQRPEIP